MKPFFEKIGFPAPLPKKLSGSAGSPRPYIALFKIASFLIAKKSINGEYKPSFVIMSFGGKGMPVYEYECVKCGARNEFVEFLGSGRIVARKCRECGSARLRKLASRAVFHPEVTLEDLGVNVIRQPAPPAGSVPQGPPGGKCPYCDPDPEPSAPGGAGGGPQKP